MVKCEKAVPSVSVQVVALAKPSKDDEETMVLSSLDCYAIVAIYTMVSLLALYRC
jgi:hypothetical protein